MSVILLSFILQLRTSALYTATHRDQIILMNSGYVLGQKGMLHSIAKGGKCDDSPQRQLPRPSPPRGRSLERSVTLRLRCATASAVRKATCNHLGRQEID